MESIIVACITGVVTLALPEGFRQNCNIVTLKGALDDSPHSNRRGGAQQLLAHRRAGERVGPRGGVHEPALSMSEKYGPDVRKLVVSCIGLLFIAVFGNKQQSSW